MKKIDSLGRSRDDESSRLITPWKQENEYAGAANAAPVLYVEEAEHYVEGLREFSIEEIGSSRCERGIQPVEFLFFLARYNRSYSN